MGGVPFPKILGGFFAFLLGARLRCRRSALAYDLRALAFRFPLPLTLGRGERFPVSNCSPLIVPVNFTGNFMRSQ